MTTLSSNVQTVETSFYVPDAKAKKHSQALDLNTKTGGKDPTAVCSN